MNPSDMELLKMRICSVHPGDSDSVALGREPSGLLSDKCPGASAGGGGVEEVGAGGREPSSDQPSPKTAARSGLPRST